MESASGAPLPAGGAASARLSGPLLRIALPLMAGSAIESLYNLGDAWFLGKLGTDAISAPSVAFSFVFMAIIGGAALSQAGTTLMAQARGAGDDALVKRYLNQSAGFLGVVSVVLAIAGSLLARSALRLLDTPDSVMVHALPYLRIVMAGTPFMFAYFLLQSSFTAIGKTMVPLVVHLAAVLLNLALDPLLIFGPGPMPALGSTGAALATVISQAVAAAVSLRILLKGRDGLKLERALLRPRRADWTLLLRIGVPSSIGQGLSALGFTVLQGLVNGFGPAAIAAFGVGNRLINLFDLPAHGIANAVTTMVGQSIGSGDEEKARRVVRSGLLLVAAFLALPIAASMVWGGSLVRFFVDDPEAIRLGDLMFKVVGPSVFLFGLFFATTGAFQGAGATKPIMVLSVARLWVVRLPIAILLARAGFGPLSIWIAMFVSNLVIALAGILYYRSGRWLKAGVRVYRQA